MSTDGERIPQALEKRMNGVMKSMKYRAILVLPTIALLVTLLVERKENVVQFRPNREPTVYSN